MIRQMLLLLLLCFYAFIVSQNTHAKPIDLSQFSFEAKARIRGEVIDNRDFTDSLDDKKSFTGNRFQLGIDFKSSEATNIFIQFQYSENWGEQSGTLTDTPSAIHQAYMQHSFSDQFFLKLGRQELLYGDQLIVGPVGWSNTGRSFDAVKTKWQHSLGFTDLFIADVSKTTNNVTTNKHYFSGIYNHLAFDQVDNLDIYVFNTNDPSGTTESHVIHYGLRVKSEWASFDYRLEATGQALLDGHQWDLEVGYSFLENSRASIGFFSSSKNYLQLFPTAHKWLGTGDFLSRRNLSGARISLSKKFLQKLKTSLDYHYFQTTDSQSTAYNFTGATLGTINNDKAIGSEVDLILSYPIDDTFDISLGGSYFFTDKYLETSGLDSNGSFYFLQTSANF